MIPKKRILHNIAKSELNISAKKMNRDGDRAGGASPDKEVQSSEMLPGPVLQVSGPLPSFTFPVVYISQTMEI